MKLTVAFSLTLVSLATPAAASVKGSVPLYRPHKVSLKALQLDDAAFKNSPARESFIDALSNVGVIAVTGISGGYASHKANVLASLHACVLDSAAAREHTFGDGTTRRTMASHTVPGPGGQQKIKHSATPEVPPSSACEAFEESSAAFRGAVAEATRAFASRLSSVLDVETPLLTTEGGTYGFSKFEDVVENGEHLEHFHSYQRSEPSVEESAKNDDINTIDMHTDQGLFIAFTPGLMMALEQGGSLHHQAKHLSGGFYIEQQDGTVAMVEFLEDDDLVFMLGDGVNQYINPKVRSGPDGEGGTKLRAAPHGLIMPSHHPNEARVWYGRMVLPPFDALHPDHGKTFGQLRKLMIDASLSGGEGTADGAALGMGCSSDLLARQLEGQEDTTCDAASSVYCWHRCMNHTEYYDQGYFGEDGVPDFQGLSVETCADAGLELKCVNPRGQLYVEGHGDYYPACTDASAAPNATAFPDLEGYPTDDDVCTEEAWEAFSSSDDYSFSYDVGAYDKATFMWNVVGNEVEGRLTFRGLFGYLGMGFANEGGRLNGMLGASILLGLPGGDYSPVTGIDVTQEPTVMEYVIHPEYTRFRHWNDPVVMNNSNYEANFTDCFTEISFRTDSIRGIPFNVTGTDDMVWAANGQNAFVEYHGGDQRDRFVVEWATGKAWDPNAMGMEHDHDDHEHGDDTETNTARTNSGSDSTKAVSSLVVLSLAVVGAWMI